MARGWVADYLDRGRELLILVLHLVDCARQLDAVRLKVLQLGVLLAQFGLLGRDLLLQLLDLSEEGESGTEGVGGSAGK
jgi:hypothetical protein